MAQSNAAPVIIKRKKILKGGGHHGGAWKVAYADFVTAMMAFFLLMWLLSATTEQQRKGLADYFNPSIPLSKVSGGGDGSFGGDSPMSEDIKARSGQGASSAMPTESRQAAGQTGTDEQPQTAEDLTREQLESLEQMLLGKSGESTVMENALRHVVTRVTDEGLIVEIFDLENEPLFRGNSAEPLPVLVALSDMLADVFVTVRNSVAVNGHTKAYPIMMLDNPVWDLSMARAQSMRVLMSADGLPESRIQRVSGFADRKPALRNTMANRNNRLEVILLRRGR